MLRDYSVHCPVVDLHAGIRYATGTGVTSGLQFVDFTQVFDARVAGITAPGLDRLRLHRGAGVLRGCLHRGAGVLRGCLHRGAGVLRGCLHRGTRVLRGRLHRGTIVSREAALTEVQES